MEYNVASLAKIKAKVFAKISREFEIAQNNETIEEFLDKYGLVIEEDYVFTSTRTMLILVFGDLIGNVNVYKKVAKNLGINPDNIVFERDYQKLTNFDLARLKNSFVYSDIIVGPNPHKIKGTDGYSSFISMVKETPHLYPRLIESSDPHGLKLSISGFKDCLTRTRYFENLCN